MQYDKLIYGFLSSNIKKGGKKMKKTAVIVSIILIFFSFVNLLNAAVTIYTDRTAWENALATSFSEETFDDAILNPGVSVVSSAGAIANGRWEDRVNSSDTTEFSFSSNLTAYGGNWDLSPGGRHGHCHNAWKRQHIYYS